MNPVSTQLELSAASIRLAGLLIESQLRVAQVFGNAALSANIFAAPAEVRKSAFKPAAASKKTAPKKKLGLSPTATAIIAPKSEASVKPSQGKTVKPTAAKPVKKVQTQVAKPQEPAPAAKAKPKETPKEVRAPKVAAKAPKAKASKKSADVTLPKMPEFKSHASKPAAPVTAKRDETAKPAQTKTSKAKAKVSPTAKAHQEALLVLADKPRSAGPTQSVSSRDTATPKDKR